MTDRQHGEQGSAPDQAAAAQSGSAEQRAPAAGEVLPDIGCVSTLLSAPPDPEMTFESFVPCKANTFPLEVARVVAAHGGSRPVFSILYVYSEIGMGKTHLLSAIFNATDISGPMMVNTADIETEIERAGQRGCRAELRQWLSTAGILLVDDIQLCEGNEALQLELFAVLNHVIRRGSAVVIASDVPPTQMAGVEHRLLSRLSSGVIVGLQMGNKSDRIALGRRFFGSTPVPAEVLDYLAEQVSDNVRRLKAAVIQLIALQEHSSVVIDLDLARAVVPLPADLRHSATPPPPAPTPESRPDGGPSAVLPIAEEAATAARFKEMLAGAQTEEEQALALQIAVGERLRQLRDQEAKPEVVALFEKALALLREGKLAEAIGCIGPQSEHEAFD